VTIHTLCLQLIENHRLPDGTLQDEGVSQLTTIATQLRLVAVMIHKQLEDAAREKRPTEGLQVVSG